ncbi:hypothetical protein D3C85_1811970 [compost metagenome]
MQGVADLVVRTVGELLLDRVMQLIARFGLHQTGVGRIDQRTQVYGRQTEMTFAIRVQKQ